MFCVPTVASALLPTPLRVHVPYRSPAIAMGEWFAPGGSSGAFLREELLLKNFLCQRAIQTQLYNHIQMKNDVHKDWIMQFVEEMGSAQLCAGSRQLHSHTALSVPWNELLSAVMDAPDETKEVEITGTNRRIGGGSPDNPYLPKVTPRTYTTKISPAAVGQHLLKVREQLAVEWKHDLGLIPLCNAELRRHRSEVVANHSDELEKLQYEIAPGSIEDEEGNGSPLRTANFDLLKTAVTHGALWRLQTELAAEPTQKHAAEWLARFVRDHGSAFRGGECGWRADRDFILGMSEQPVSVGKSLGGNPRFIDPVGMAYRLMDLREAVALEWTEAMKLVPVEHVALRVEEHRARLEVSVVWSATHPPRVMVEPPPPAGFVWAKLSGGRENE